MLLKLVATNAKSVHKLYDN